MYKLNLKETIGNPINFQLFAGKIVVNCTNWFETHDVNSMIPDDDEYNTCFKTVDFVRNEIRRKVNPYGMYTQAGYPLLSAELLPKQTFGRCADYVNLGVLTYRSLGLPAIIDEAPFWGRYRAGHTWYTILGDRGQELPAEWDLGSVPGWQFFPYERIPKVWRQTFAYNEDVLDYRMHSKFKFPFPLCRKDVSDHYMRPIDVEIPIRNDPKTGKSTKLVEPYAYIAIFNGHGEDWSIFDFGKIKKKKVIFHNIGRNILYIALGYNGRSLVPISEPFILEQNGNIRYIHCDSNHLRSIDVHRKYYQSTNVVNMRRRIIGAKIQYADTPDFSDAVTVHTIDTTLIPDKIEIEEDGSHRYWRYCGADGTYGSIAELAFFDTDTMRLTGKIIGCLESSEESRLKAFDNNWLSNFETSEGFANGAWVGIAFDVPKHIRFVRVVPRGDDNDICPGNEYELKYWNENGTWTSLGITTAENNYLHYDNVPKGALFWISNYTRGWDERPFLINEDSGVEWW